MKRTQKCFFLAFAFTAFLLTGSVEKSYCQALFYNIGEVYIDSGVTVHVNGTFSNAVTAHAKQLPTLLENNGTITTRNDKNPGHFIINNTATVRGNGTYNVEQNWINNSPNFEANRSKVVLDGDLLQLITGSEVTTFSQLILTGTGLTGTDRVKQLRIDCIVKDTLNLNDRELAADSFEMYVDNPAIEALLFSDTLGKEGYVSSLIGSSQNGRLARKTSNSAEAYIFPVGSSINPPSGKEYVYRPVEITPSSASLNIFNVRFTYNDPTDDGYDVDRYDTSTCTVNDLYYHMINHPLGFDSAHTAIVYDPIEDGTYDRLSRWQFSPDSSWNIQLKSRLSSDVTYNRITLRNNRIFSNDTMPFALSDLFPDKPTVTGPGEVCSGSNNQLFIASSNTNFYEWQVPAGVTIASGAENDSVRLNFGNTGGYILGVASSATGTCKEVSDSVLVIVNPTPTAAFMIDTNDVFTRFKIQFTDTSSGTPVEWLWHFGDGDSSLSPIPRHAYDEIGEYPVVLTIKDAKGCIDSTSMLIRIIEGIKIPNVFTPNGDGVNDFFRIANSGLSNYTIRIFNRWGNLVFETTAPEIVWDGRTPSGAEVLPGTYYYILDAGSTTTDYSTKGYITVFR
jgi:gliding motility-associated-like protein